MLYIVATPIGNLEDITLRALRILREVDFILAEDTRITKRLLEHYGIDKPMISYHHHSDQKKIDQIAALLEQGKNLALVTDAGTPGISDPGNKLIYELIVKFNNRLEIVPIPGPSALTSALSISGFPTDKFLFLGFIPHRKGRQKFLSEVLENDKTVIFYESCHRIVKCLEQLSELIKTSDIIKPVVVCRELTKKFETVYRGNIGAVLEDIKNDPLKGEYTVIVGWRGHI
ncbi:16S rRNA (cytidine(1402)-2'-O)-methyltransferase [Candidatus Kuenenbacteria bacterium CG08_land_8_20_14_0_20_37_23]|uniref:Ribosomal RNA small subunit methyltransferase I n=2 Tax=Candidatus Kueneniibacteriota TaxID=1752740 RepID=A0A2M6XSU6_9BACT|nr:MAG: 16S rRNA (cytidine(1402)-2'-O)-methyltransferase [Candidatus Kuenenbacteria bacterium CG1_02_38_13]PIU10712.1 MAG: 16S rRNA (cytidine(1402)-2'-O)-methyltransferase [Candidatus Kuenenbacteria bacterium CG08_land_8_20_14_0_20_37_23]